MKKSIPFAVIMIASILVCSAALTAQDDLTGSIVKIYTVYNKHSYFRPWQMEGQRSATGSGCIIDGNRILTNAHVVADATFIQVKRAGTAKNYTAEVAIVGHECDLAVLQVKDGSFFEGAEPVAVGELAEVRDNVATYGFPAGGEELAMDGENIGYMVSVPVIRHFPYYEVGEPVRERRQIVVLATVLADEINVGYQDLEDVVIVEANGKNVADMEDLVEAVEGNDGPFHVFVDSMGKQIVLERVRTDERSGVILENYRVGADRSGDLERQ